MKNEPSPITPITPPLEVMPPPTASVLEELNTAKADLATAQRANAILEEKIEVQRIHLAELQNNSFNYVLQNLDAGAVLEELDEKMKQLTLDVERRQKKGVISVALTLDPYKPGTFTIVGTVTVKAPPEEPAQSIFYPDETGRLSRKDSRQRDLPFAE